MLAHISANSGFSPLTSMPGHSGRVYVPDPVAPRAIPLNDEARGPFARHGNTKLIHAEARTQANAIWSSLCREVSAASFARAKRRWHDREAASTLG